MPLQKFLRDLLLEEVLWSDVKGERHCEGSREGAQNSHSVGVFGRSTCVNTELGFCRSRPVSGCPGYYR